MAAATLTRSTRVVGLMLATMCLVCFANLLVVEEKLEIIRAQFRNNEKFLQSEKAKFESERKRILEMADCNMAKLNILRKLPNLSASELKDIENLTLTTDAYVMLRPPPLPWLEQTYGGIVVEERSSGGYLPIAVAKRNSEQAAMMPLLDDMDSDHDAGNYLPLFPQAMHREYNLPEYDQNIAQEIKYYRRRLFDATRDSPVLLECRGYAIAERMHNLQEGRKQLLKEICENDKEAISKGKRSLEDLSDSELENLVVDDKHGIIYCYIPKVACTNWKRVMYVLKHGEPYQDPSSIYDQYVHGFGNLRLLSNYPRIERKAKLKHYTKFLFVRDPFVRLISAFRDKFEDSKNDYYYNPSANTSSVSTTTRLIHHALHFTTLFNIFWTHRLSRICPLILTGGRCIVCATPASFSMISLAIRRLYRRMLNSY
ncbi:unnamed protein product [Pleuronectes platessa]|uniref:Carbohydrate sulfotransferase n=1 Tax=Pleuronectes platessa TaxID=8262 RepID=A0A9N7YG93_PLEPL|nr:unnamed protein product [Pleuronectes platessa]